MDNTNQNTQPPIGTPVQGPSAPVTPVQPPIVNPTNPNPSGMPTPAPVSGEPKKKNKILVLILLIVALLVLGGIGFYVLSSGVLNPSPATVQATPTPTSITPSPTPGELETEQDLNNTLNELDKETPESIQNELDQNTKDSSEFTN